MKKTLIALLAVSSLALGANITVTDDISFGGDEHKTDRLDFQFNDSTNRTVTLTTTSDATIAATDGYGLENGTNGFSNTLHLDITGTLTITGTFKGTGANTPSLSHIDVVTALTADEAAAITSAGVVSRDVIKMDYLQSLTSADVLTLMLSNAPDGYADGGLLAKLNDTFYAADDIVFGTYWSIKNGAEAAVLADKTIYTYVTITADNGAAPKAIGFIVAPEPATATLSLLALAGLAARRRRH